MTVTTSRKVYLSVLGIALCALVADRCLSKSATPTAAQASAPPAWAASAPSVTAAERPGIAPTALSVDTLAARLQALQAATGQQPIRDAFAPSPAWLATPRSGPSVTSQRILNFRGSHKLSAIIQTAGAGEALIDNSLMVVGQFLDGFKLIAVNQRGAVFSDGQSSFYLHLDHSISFEQPLQSE